MKLKTIQRKIKSLYNGETECLIWGLNEAFDIDDSYHDARTVYNNWDDYIRNSLYEPSIEDQTERLKALANYVISCQNLYCLFRHTPRIAGVLLVNRAEGLKRFRTLKSAYLDRHYYSAIDFYAIINDEWYKTKLIQDTGDFFAHRRLPSSGARRHRGFHLLTRFLTFIQYKSDYDLDLSDNNPPNLEKCLDIIEDTLLARSDQFMGTAEGSDLCTPVEPFNPQLDGPDSQQWSDASTRPPVYRQNFFRSVDAGHQVLNGQNPGSPPPKYDDIDFRTSQDVATDDDSAGHEQTMVMPY